MALTSVLVLSSVNPNLTALSLLVSAVLGLTALARWKRQRWVLTLSIAVASSTLIYAGIYVQPLDLISLYGVLLLVMMTGRLSGLTETVRPLAHMGPPRHQANEVDRVLTVLLARLGVILTASFIISALIWTTLGYLGQGLTSANTAFFLALLVIVILALLTLRPEGG